MGDGTSEAGCVAWEAIVYDSHPESTKRTETGENVTLPKKSAMQLGRM